MKKSLIVAALALASAPAWAQSNVTLYGIVDVGLRHTTNEGPVTDKSKSRTAMVGGGMSQSRWGIRGTEDLGGGSKVLFNMEQRVLPQTGAIISGSTYFQQAWVAYENASFGRITMGRQYNALFDLYTSTFVSYPYSPYFDQFKPEIGFAAGARFNELIKYTANFGQFRFQLEATLRGESDTSIAGVPGVYNTGGKGYAGYLRWANAGWSSSNAARGPPSPPSACSATAWRTPGCRSFGSTSASPRGRAGRSPSPPGRLNPWRRSTQSSTSNRPLT